MEESARDSTEELILAQAKDRVESSCAGVYFERRKMEQWDVDGFESLNKKRRVAWQHEHICGLGLPLGNYTKGVAPVLPNEDAVLTWAFARKLCAD